MNDLLLQLSDPRLAGFVGVLFAVAAFGVLALIIVSVFGTHGHAQVAERGLSDMADAGRYFAFSTTIIVVLSIVIITAFAVAGGGA